MARHEHEYYIGQMGDAVYCFGCKEVWTFDRAVERLQDFEMQWGQWREFVTKLKGILEVDNATKDALLYAAEDLKHSFEYYHEKYKERE